MNRINKHIEIVSSTRPGLSSMSNESRQAILATLTPHYSHVSITIIDDVIDLQELVQRRPDLVFLGMKFLPVGDTTNVHDADKIWLAAYFDEHEIAYTGSPHTAHNLELNKHLAKQRVMEAGLATSPFYVTNDGRLPDKEVMPLDFPVFIKPANRGGGLGIDSNSLAHDSDQLQSKVRSIAELQSDSIIEQYLPGREFSVAILKDERTSELQAMPIELVAEADEDGLRILSASMKSSNREQALEVADNQLREQVNALAIDVFQELGARDYGRIDIRLDAAGKPHFLEANLIPSLIGGYGSFPKACLLNQGINYEPMILSIVSLALGRSVEIDVSEFQLTDSFSLAANS